jgi:hypothetical protein
VVAVALPLAWLAGESHRSNCMREGKSDCSVLPWSSGRYPKAEKVSEPAPLTPQEREQRRINDAIDRALGNR